MDWLAKLIDNLPEILKSLSGNAEGLVGFIWLVSSITLYFVFKGAPTKWRALIFLAGLLGVVYLAHLIINKNNEILADLGGYTYYQVDTQGKLAPPDGRLYLIKGAGRQYGQIAVGDFLKVADKDGAKLYDVPHKLDEHMIVITDGFACLRVTETGHPVPVSNPPGSGGWLKVQTIRCG